MNQVSKGTDKKGGRYCWKGWLSGKWFIVCSSELSKNEIEIRCMAVITAFWALQGWVDSPRGSGHM